MGNKRAKMKMKKIGMIILAMLGIATAFGQSAEIEEMLKKRYPDAFVVEQTGYYAIYYNYGKPNQKSGACDLSGKEIIPPTKYTDVSLSFDKICYYVSIGDKKGVCDLTGKEIMPPTKYTDVVFYYDESYYRVEVGDKIGVCDLIGKEIIPPTKYQKVYLNINKEYYDVSLGDKQGICNLSGKEIIPPTKYTKVYLQDDYFEVFIGDKVGVCDLSGKEIVPCQYRSVFYSGGKYTAILKEGDSYTYFNYQNSPTTSSESNSLKLTGPWYITYENVKLEGKIKNDQPENWTSGTPLLKVFMTSSPYNGTGEIKGHLYCQLQTSQIKGGYVSTIDENYISYTKPPAGTYYTVLGLYEYKSGEYKLVDYKNFNDTRTYSAASATPSYQQPSYQPLQQDNSYLISQYQYWENIARDYYQKLGYETDASLRMTYLSGYKQAQAQMQQIRPQAAHVIQQSAFEFAQPPSNPGK